jgi:tRNA dimethylallyltransferase
LIRALEVFEVSGIPLSVHQRKKPKRPALQAPCLWLERDDIRARIMLRLKEMVANGYWEECARILDEGWSINAKPLLSFSYRYMLSCLKDGGSKEEAIEKTGFGTWKLVRKQRTWRNGLGWASVHPNDGWKWIEENHPFLS